MSRIHSKDTGPEKLVRSLLFRLGYRFRLHRSDLPGKPDIVLPKYHAVIFVHGCFWHQHQGCPRATKPKTNVGYWNAKLKANKQRDQLVQEELISSGWNVIIVWECELKNLQGLRKRLGRELNKEH